MIKQRLNTEKSKYEKFDSENPTEVLGTKKDGSPYKNVELEETKPLLTKEDNEFLESIKNTDAPGELEENEVLKENVAETPKVEKPKKEKSPKKDKAATEETKPLSEWLEIDSIVLLEDSPFRSEQISMETKISKNVYKRLMKLCPVRNITK